MKKIALLGSTGSIGQSTLSICESHPERFHPVAFAAGTNLDVAYAQCVRWRPQIISLATEELAAQLSARLKAAGIATEVVHGAGGAVRVATLPEVDFVVSAVVGVAGLEATYAAVLAGKAIGLANKECLVAAGDLILAAAREHNAVLLPIDSEHNAIHQCLRGGLPSEVKQIWLTASGGPFRNLPLAEFSSITPAQALKHPTWVMGRRITVDSATMLNKGLEIIEACRLFNLPPAQVRVTVHPQSTIHSLVEFIDGSILAQISVTDMRLPILYALAWPERIAAKKEDGLTFDMASLSQLDFQPPDLERFPCLRLAYEAAAASQNHCIALNAADEIAVEAFLDHRLPFTGIPRTIEKVLALTPAGSPASIREVLAADIRAREMAREQIAKQIKKGPLSEILVLPELMHILHTLVLFAIVLGILVLIHELGHFVMAKLCGVKVEIFSIGFGPRIVGYRFGDTDYRISALPLGGYVKMFGDEPGQPPAMDVLGVDIVGLREFNSRPRWQRVLIALSGPIANFILAFFLLFLVSHYHHEVDKYLTGPAVVDYVPLNTPAAHDGLAAGDTITRFGGDIKPTWDQISKDAALNVNHTQTMSYLHNGQTITRDIFIATGDNTDQPGPDMLSATGLIPRESDDSLIVNDVSAGGPGDRVGLKPNDHIVSINGLQVHSLDTLIAYLQDSNGAAATLVVTRDNQPLTLQLTPEKGDNGQGAIKWLIGFHARHVPVQIEHLSFGQSIVQSAKDNWDSSTLILRILKGMFTRHVSIKAVSGPVGIAQQIEIASEQGIWPLTEFTAMISIQLGIFNLLPIPILDGGMILFLLIESIIRRDVNEVLKERIYQVAFVGIILLAVFVFVNDISRMHH